MKGTKQMEKTIDINDKKYLFIYKSLFFKLFKFSTTSKDEEMQAIVNALNIKNRKTRIEYVYDYCCNKIDKFYEGKNLCDFKDNKCRIQRIGECKNKNGCCRLCSYQSSQGCTTSNLTCKFFYCANVMNRFEIIHREDLKILKLFSLRQRFILGYDYFSTRESVIRDLFLGSIVISAIRIEFHTLIGLAKLKYKKVI